MPWEEELLVDVWTELEDDPKLPPGLELVCWKVWEVLREVLWDWAKLREALWD